MEKKIYEYPIIELDESLITDNTIVLGWLVKEMPKINSIFFSGYSISGEESSGIVTNIEPVDFHGLPTTEEDTIYYKITMIEKSKEIYCYITVIEDGKSLPKKFYKDLRPNAKRVFGTSQ